MTPISLGAASLLVGCGSPYQLSDYLPKDTVQAVRHKRKSSRRWQKKYRKKFGYKQVNRLAVYSLGFSYIMSPETEKYLIERLGITIL